MSVKCLINGLEVNYPCSPACALFGDCVTAFEVQKKENVRTNADRIRAMSDDELAAFLYRFEYGTGKLGACWDCQGEALQWLREPADQNDAEDEDEDECLPRIGRWVFWDGWVSNHDLRIDDAFCSVCGYDHPAVRWEAGDPIGAEAAEAVLGKLAKECPRCGAKMIGGDEDVKERGVQLAGGAVGGADPGAGGG